MSFSYEAEVDLTLHQVRRLRIEYVAGKYIQIKAYGENPDKALAGIFVASDSEAPAEIEIIRENQNEQL